MEKYICCKLIKQLLICSSIMTGVGANICYSIQCAKANELAPCYELQFNISKQKAKILSQNALQQAWWTN